MSSCISHDIYSGGMSSWATFVFHSTPFVRTTKADEASGGQVKEPVSPKRDR